MLVESWFCYNSENKHGDNQFYEIVCKCNGIIMGSFNMKKLYHSVSGSFLIYVNYDCYNFLFI